MSEEDSKNTQKNLLGLMILTGMMALLSTYVSIDGIWNAGDAFPGRKTKWVRDMILSTQLSILINWLASVTVLGGVFYLSKLKRSEIVDTSEGDEKWGPLARKSIGVFFLGFALLVLVGRGCLETCDIRLGVMVTSRYYT